ncbi:MAG: ornithine cyclodeaminase family protein [Nitrososphaerota archaeon]|nr:ornithine cyclodeaminase family protein [Nitrososphaerota archaeon]
MTLLISDSDVTRLLAMGDCMSALEDAYRDIGNGRAVNAPRRDSFMMSSVPEAYFSFKTMEGGSERLEVMAQRINSDMVTHPVVGGARRRVKVPAAPGNRYVGLVFLYSTRTLELLAIMNDGELQRMRVAGVTGLGVRHLSNPDAEVAAIIGTGWQAEAAALAIAEARKLKKLKVFSPDRSHREAFAAKFSGRLGLDVVPVGTARDAVAGSQIVAAATNSHVPVMNGKWIEPGMHLTSIRRFEFDVEAWKRADMVYFTSPTGTAGFRPNSSETWKKARKSDVDEEMKLEDELVGKFRKKVYSLSDLLVGRATGRKSGDQVTLFHKNWGLGIEFASAGKLVYERALKEGLGTEVPTERFSQTSHP